jgi:hypothetical protein
MTTITVSVEDHDKETISVLAVISHGKRTITTRRIIARCFFESDFEYLWKSMGDELRNAGMKTRKAKVLP